jgi:hypothetical protein
VALGGELTRRKAMARRTLLPGFSSPLPRQELGAEGARSRGAPYGLDGRHRWGSAVAAGGEQGGDASAEAEQSRGSAGGGSEMGEGLLWRRPRAEDRGGTVAGEAVATGRDDHRW